MVNPLMGAPKGNQFWKQRASHGRDKLFKSPDALWEACQEYFQWIEDNPLWELKATQYQGSVVEMPLPKMHAMTIAGLCIFLDIHRDTWYAWREDNDFSDIVERAETVIYHQKLSGAAADLLNSNIIARELKLTDKVEQDVNINNYTELPDDELARKLAEKRQEHEQSKVH
jgi:hypothetical protein